MKPIIQMSSSSVQILVFSSICFMLCDPMLLHAAPDAARFTNGDLKVDGIHFSVDGSVQTKASPWGYGALNGVDIGFLNNVGIGTLTPTANLEVVGTVKATQFSGTNLNITGNFTLPESTSVNVGTIMKGTTPFIHNFGTNNTFVGESAGNFTLSGTFNTGIGNSALYSTTSGSYNTALGSGALFNNTTGSSNTAIGELALSNNTGNYNTAVGQSALQVNTTGNYNTATGQGALNANTGSYNTANGMHALFSNTAGSYNTAIGQGALEVNQVGNYNTATGTGSLHVNIGSYNTADGMYALTSNTIGGYNTAIGQGALQLNTIGNYNTAVGQGALVVNTASNNTAIGQGALQGTTSGSNNTAIGQGALQNNTYHMNNTAIGYGALRNLNGSFTNDNNIAVGASAGSSVINGAYNIYIGNIGIDFDNYTIRIGDYNQNRTFISGIYNKATLADARPVIIDSSGQLGTQVSSRRFKDDITDMGDASSPLMKLRPVTFHYKSDQNPAGRSLQYGLIAEEVAEEIPELVAHSANGEIETVYYQFLAPMLLNEYQKQQYTIEAQNAHIAALEKDRTQQSARIEALEKQAAKIASLEEQSARMARLLMRLDNPDMLVDARR